MSDLFEQHRERMASLGDKGVLKGIFCDCVGTLYGGKHGLDKELAAFLNEQHEAGQHVVIFSSEPQSGMKDIFDFLGLKPDLQDVKRKGAYNGQTLELIIDDDPAEGAEFITHINPADDDFRDFLKQPRDGFRLNP